MSFFRKLRAPFRQKELDADMAEEMRLHLERRVDENVAQGMSPEEARDVARRDFGGVDQVKEIARDQRGFGWFDPLWQDGRYALRQLAKSPSFAVMAVLSLALGIGANTAIFSVINDYVFRPLPVKDPQGLVLFQWLGVPGGGPRSIAMDASQPDVDRATGRELGRLFPGAALAMFRAGAEKRAEIFAVAVLARANVEIDGEVETAGLGQLVSGNYYTALGVPVSHGRTLGPADDRSGAEPVVVISDDFWHRRLAGDPAAVGKTIWVNRVAATIVGITPEGFAGNFGSGGVVDLTLPLALARQIRDDRASLNDPSYWWLRLMGRLDPGVTMEQARAVLEPALAAVAQDAAIKPDKRPRLTVTPGGERYSGTARASMLPLFALLMGMVALVLVAACANVANLLVARGAARRREIAVRLALGASRARIVRQLLTESVLLAGLGAGLGFLFAAWGLGALGTVMEGQGDGFGGLGLDWRVLGFSTTLALLTGVLFGLAPALRATRLDLNAEFQGGVRNLGQGARSRLSQALMIVQVAISLVLLVGAGLFVRTVRNLRAVDVGFDRSHLLLFSLEASPAGYQPGQFADFFARAADHIGAIPGVQAVSFSSLPMVSNASTRIGLSFPGETPVPGQDAVATLNHVGPDFFATYAMPLVLGRDFNASDAAPTARTAIVNEALARKYFSGQSAVGRLIRFSGMDWEIVGVVHDVKQLNLRAAVPPTVSVTYGWNAPARAEFAVRTNGAPMALAAAVRQAVREVDKNVPLNRVRTQDQQIERTLTKERIFADLAGLLGLLALALASVGLYGLMSFVVLRRTGEMGLRMALGALPRQVLGAILRQSLGLVAIGAGLGLITALALMRLVATQLFGLSPADPLTYGGVILLLTVVALLACWLPARRAARIAPMNALRTE